MSTYITQIGKRKFVCGLFWQSLSRPRELLKEAHDLAKKIDFDLLVLRKDYATAQAGFAHALDGARGPVYSLAVAVAHALAQQHSEFEVDGQPAHNWLAAFALPDGMWAYFAVRDANFLPNGDFAGTREEVFDRLRGDYGLGGWNLVLGDAELEMYGFHHFVEKRIVDILGHKGGQIRVQRQWALRPLASGLTKRGRLMLAAGILTGVAAGLGWFAYQSRQERADQAKALILARMRLQSTDKIVPAPHPWAEEPSPLAFAEACRAQSPDLAAAGWQLEQYQCTAQTVEYTWTRQDSTVALLQSQVGAAVPDITNDRASHSVALPALATRDDKLLPYQTLMGPIVARLQMLRLSMNITAMPPPPTDQASRPQGTALPNWRTYHYVIKSTQWQPSMLAALLEQPGIRFSKLTYQRNVWTIEGSIYAK